MVSSVSLVMMLLLLLVVVMMMMMLLLLLMGCGCSGGDDQVPVRRSTMGATDEPADAPKVT